MLTASRARVCRGSPVILSIVDRLSDYFRCSDLKEPHHRSRLLSSAPNAARLKAVSCHLSQESRTREETNTDVFFKVVGNAISWKQTYFSVQFTFSRKDSERRKTVFTSSGRWRQTTRAVAFAVFDTTENCTSVGGRMRRFFRDRRDPLNPRASCIV